MYKRFLSLFLLLPVLFTAVSGWSQDGAEKAPPAKKSGASGKAAASKAPTGQKTSKASTTPATTKSSTSPKTTKAPPAQKTGTSQKSATASKRRRAGQERSQDDGPAAGEFGAHETHDARIRGFGNVEADGTPVDRGTHFDCLRRRGEIRAAACRHGCGRHGMADNRLRAHPRPRICEGDCAFGKGKTLRGRVGRLRPIL